MSDFVPFRRLCLIGIGLIASSIAHAARENGLAETIVCATPDPAHRKTALELSLVEEAFASNAEAVRGADLVILCTPPGAMGGIAHEIAGELAEGTIVSDVGSVKEKIVEAVGPVLPAHARFVPAHPIAGTENSGPAAGFASLFRNRWTIITPNGHADADSVARVRSFWEGMGALVEEMDAKHHDQVLAITSHIPHLIAYNIVGTADDLEAVTKSEVIKFSAAGFRDFTRIAASDPTMWRDVFLNNREAVLEMLGRFSEDLTALQRAIRWGDGETLFNLFTRTREIRRAIIDAGQETDAPNFGQRRAAGGKIGPFRIRRQRIAGLTERAQTFAASSVPFV
ncbi:MAG: prephenate/arogenate dehydrogenase family protein [Minwuia sp.]|uniref:prephenate/arogenate dehydrogenase family protein n=1 Tax=Minwuia sp. TaxID=2493630 RepID=UPI003A89E697